MKVQVWQLVVLKRFWPLHTSQGPQPNFFKHAILLSLAPGGGGGGFLCSSPCRSFTPLARGSWNNSALAGPACMTWHIALNANQRRFCSALHRGYSLSRAAFQEGSPTTAYSYVSTPCTWTYKIMVPPFWPYWKLVTDILCNYSSCVRTTLKTYICSTSLSRLVAPLSYDHALHNGPMRGPLLRPYVASALLRKCQTRLWLRVLSLMSAWRLYYKADIITEIAAHMFTD